MQIAQTTVFKRLLLQPREHFRKHFQFAARLVDCSDNLFDRFATDMSRR